MVKPPTGLPSVLEVNTDANITESGKSPISESECPVVGLKKIHVVWKTGLKVF